MRTILPLISCCFLVICVSAKEKVQINPNPTWLYAIHPDLNKTPIPRNISDGYYFELLDLAADPSYIGFLKGGISSPEYLYI
jgi:hypothetical protein